MLYLITDDYNRVLTTVAAPDDDAVSIAVERADKPDLCLFSADLYSDGSVHVGHWPDGEDWERVLTTHGVPNAYGSNTPARPAPVPPLDTQDAVLITCLLQAAIDQHTLPDGQHERAAHLLRRLTAR
ncbi:hypothetical protein ACFYNX_26385 [Streptomyces sp. NPDC007872]|uniref:hypothetical protein n=1 Tax=Streptomyces sp. NPDC007872 TaxID=3364782 RepID=UPI0036AB7D63